ncbi:MAG: M48 family metalloprotease [Acidobacteria bacterium]|nr:M48 family metalloprotease [Acidobacteriota bacterium]
MPIELPALGAGVLHALWLGTLIAGWTALTLRLLGDRPAALRHRVALAALLAIGLSVPAGALLGADVTAWWCTAIGGTWLLLAMVRLARLINSLRAVRRLRAAAQPVTGPWTAHVAGLAQTMRIDRPVEVLESGDVDVPGHVGTRRPVILVPSGTLERLTPDEILAVTAHELAHVQRHDYAWNLAQRFVEAIAFFHPATPWLTGVVARERERACDVVAARHCTADTVARALVSLERQRGGTRQPDAGGAALLTRVRSLIEAPAASATAPLSGAAVAVIGIGVVALIGSMALLARLVPGTQPGTATLMASTGVALLFGLRHACEPDHVSAVATLVSRAERPATAAWLGASWGVGHAVSLLAAGAVLAWARVLMPARVEHLLEVVVAAMIVGMGLRALRDAHRLASAGPETTHTHGDVVHVHASSGRHLHIGPWTLASQPLSVGLVHGLAGSGALTAMAVAAIPSVPAQLLFMAVFGIGAAAGMALVAGMAGQAMARLVRSPRALAAVTAASGAIAVVVGMYWAWPALVGSWPA